MYDNYIIDYADKQANNGNLWHYMENDVTKLFDTLL